MKTFLQRLPRISDRLMGNHCYLCARGTVGVLCPSCERLLLPVNQACPQCSLPTPVAALCGECQLQSPSFDKIICAFEYYFPLPQLVNGFKHRQHLRCGKLLADYLSQTLPSHYGDAWPDTLCATPLHWRRRLLRGFNQAESIAGHLAHALQRPLRPLLKKTRVTASQQSLNRKQRLHNLEGSFNVNPKFIEHIQQRHIAVVDDVVTTAATAEVISTVLKKHGARRVDIWAIARTPKAP